MLMANSTNDINFNTTTNSRPNTNPLPHRDLLHPKVKKLIFFFSFEIKHFFLSICLIYDRN